MNFSFHHIITTWTTTTKFSRLFGSSCLIQSFSLYDAYWPTFSLDISFCTESQTPSPAYSCPSFSLSSGSPISCQHPLHISFDFHSGRPMFCCNGQLSTFPLRDFTCIHKKRYDHLLPTVYYRLSAMNFCVKPASLSSSYSRDIISTPNR